jgi:hypothetical protein
MQSRGGTQIKCFIYLRQQGAGWRGTLAAERLPPQARGKGTRRSHDSDAEGWAVSEQGGALQA